MKQIIFTVFLTIMQITFSMATSVSLPSDSTGLPGDNFSLEGALDLFKQSSSPEEFEQKLNKEDNKVNNLDLNADGQVDYIRVEDHSSDEAHAIVLQVVVAKDEEQDIAVIEIEKVSGDSAILQIIGDQDIYGESVIVEPVATELKEGKGGPSMRSPPARVVVNVWFGYPCVRYVYMPGYVSYRSPYRWRAYPRWWKPWRPVRWGLYVSWWAPVRFHYHVVPTHRVVRAHRVYTPVRRTSITVSRRNQPAINTYRSSRRIGVGSRTTTTVVKGEKGTAVSRKTTTGSVRKSADGSTKGTKVTKRTGVVKTDKGVLAGQRTNKRTVKKRGDRKISKRKTTTTKAAAGKRGTKASSRKSAKKARSTKKRKH
ncbi:MAG: hypothetical protein OEQ53_08995 [Saprospiraceae bacterium]|nr:hypothetical protein [Saprospiraceae bacterium]